MRKNLALVAALLAATAAPAHAATTTVDFSLLDGTTTVGSGTFSFDAAKTGQLTYSDLDTFSFSLPGGTYDLAFTQSGSFSDYYYFGYNATSQSFVASNINGFSQYLSAIKSSFDSGYYVGDASPYVLRNYGPESGDVRFTDFSISSMTAGVPEPATWGLMILGFGAVGGAMRRRQRVATRISFATA